MRPVGRALESDLPGPADLWFESGLPGRFVRVYLGSDSDGLHVLVLGPDVTPEQEFHGLDIWRGDSVQLGFDLLDDDCPLQCAPDDAEYGFALHEATSEIACWVSGEPAPSHG